MKDQWKQGLQWGGVVWLSYLAGCSLVTACESAEYGLYLPHMLPAAAWLAALALLWTRWARAGAAVAIAVQVAAGMAEASRFDTGTLTWPPLVLPVLPLVFMAPERPRLTVALALVGRWRDAGRALAGWRWIVVAMGTFLLARSGGRALHCWVYDFDGALNFSLESVLNAFIPQALLFGAAALPRRSWRFMA